MAPKGTLFFPLGSFFRKRVGLAGNGPKRGEEVTV